MKKWLILPTLFVGLNASANDKKTLHLVTMNWNPFYGKDLKENGFFAALVREALKRDGITLKIDWAPWKRAMVTSERGKYDGVLGAFHTDERAQKYHFSAPVAYSRVALFKLKNNASVPENYTTLKALNKYKIGVGRGYAVTKEFDTADYLNKVVANNQILNIRKLHKKRVDFVAGGYEAILFEMNKSPDLQKIKDDIVAVKPFLAKSAAYVIISKNSKNHSKGEFLTSFNKRLEEMKKDGTYEAIFKRFGMRDF